MSIFTRTKKSIPVQKVLKEKKSTPSNRFRKFLSATLLVAGLILPVSIIGCTEEKTKQPDNDHKVSDVFKDALVQPDAKKDTSSILDSTSDLFVLPDLQKDGKGESSSTSDADTSVPDAVKDIPVQQPDTQKEQEGAAWDSGSGDFSCVVDPQIIANEGGVDIDPSKIEVHDGDTMAGPDETYRLSAADAAELAACINGKGWPDQYGTDEFSDLNYGQLGKKYAIMAFLSVTKAKVVKGKLDDFNRRLGYFALATDKGYELLQCLLVREGLAWETVSYYGLGSHPPLAQLVLDASKYAGEPNFTNPYLYKKNTQSCQE